MIRNEKIFDDKNKIDLLDAHTILIKSYYSMFFSENKNNYISIQDLIKLRQIEREIFDEEINYCLINYQCSTIIRNEDVIINALKNHSVYQHGIFDYFRDEASLEDLRHFVIQGSTLILSFTDYLAMGLIGSSTRVKSEILTNLWDEVGKGDSTKAHSVTFNKLMLSLGLTYDRKNIISQLPWQALAGINLFGYLSFYPFNKMKFIGLLAATEILDSLHYNKLNQGIERIFTTHDMNPTIHAEHYVSHESIDTSHATQWINNIVIPELTLHPSKTEEFWIGFYMRLDSIYRYYNKLLNDFRYKIFTK